MLFHNQKIFSRLLVLGGLLLLLFLGQFILTQQPALAILRQHQDAPGVMRYHSQQSLLDESGQAWQVVLFKQITPGKPTLFHLRLVGFPGVAEVAHPQHLEITTATGKILTAADIFAPRSPAANVGEYNFTDALNLLGTSGSLTLSIPLKSQQNMTLKIPTSLVTEWQLLVTEITDAMLPSSFLEF
ncbi:DUF3122 domain-containing protein [Microcoleus sp. FACHB-831]|uniref:DUF3122 domain-containing protein n=1 Tax=Microcoleus sp. FACHB-831 TaxID=2692827 RepID=UPI0016831E57|nr:DUF3122 domain-containing protein [Microcoleus sp. FACHB-831]MBD1924528.1 DUF3122 domain-containing protein [Microcoleus sp. FACHB-831]